MARQNLHVLKASLGWRELEPGTYTVEKIAALRGRRRTATSSGLDLGQLYELNGRLKLRNFASVFARRRLRAGALRRPRGRQRHRAANARATSAGGSSSRRDPRAACSTRRCANQTQLMGAGIYATGGQAERGRARAPPARHRAAAAGHLVGGRVPLRAPGGRRRRLLLRQADRQQRERDAARVVHVHAAADAAGLRAGVPRRRAISTTSRRLG